MSLFKSADHARAMYKEHRSSTVMADILGVSVSCVLDNLHKMGVEVSRRDMCPYTDDELRAEYERGSLGTIAKKCGVTVPAVHGWLSRRGIARKGVGGNNNPLGLGGHNRRKIEDVVGGGHEKTETDLS